MNGSRQLPPLFQFAFHPTGDPIRGLPSWLEDVAQLARPEPWGSSHKILELYLRANYEIAVGQGKVVEDRDNGVAFWRAGSLVNKISDPIWLIYGPNNRPSPYWKLTEVRAGAPPMPIKRAKSRTIEYNAPHFRQEWTIDYDSMRTHIMLDSENQTRIKRAFSSHGASMNEHLFLMAIYGQAECRRKEGDVHRQWYRGGHQFLMPLYLPCEDQVGLIACLQPEPSVKQYRLRTLLPPAYAYAHARAVVKNRADLPGWLLLSEQELNQVGSNGDREDP